MKKISAILMSAVLAAGSLSVCVPAQASENGGAPQIVTTIFPEYDWVMNILGDNPAGAEVTMLLDSGVDLHSYQPTAKDILKISTCDVFIYVGGESDDWVEDALKEASNENMVVINLLEALGDSAKEEEMVEGMQESEHEHDHDDEAGHDEEGHDEEAHEEAEGEESHDEGAEGEEAHDEGAEGEEAHDEEAEGEEAHDEGAHDEDGHDEDEEHEHEHEHGDAEYDEHVWLSLRNAAALTKSICEALQTADPDNAGVYEANAQAYTDKLAALDQQYQETVSGASYDTILFGDRFPFRYLVDDYDLSYYAAFVGCSAETEASFETITFLAQKVDELSLHTVLTIEGTDHRIAETIVQNTQTKDQQILSMDSMQSTTGKDAQNGTTYLSIMESNLSVLADALK